MNATRGRRDLFGVAWGLFFIGLGLVFLIGQMDGLPTELIRRAWPLWPALFGAAMLVGARTAKRVADGVFMIGLAGYLFVSNEELLGLDWRNSWPLVLVAVGLSQVVGVIAARWLPEREPGEKGCADA